MTPKRFVWGFFIKNTNALIFIRNVVGKCMKKNRKYINEDVTSSEVRSIVNSKLNDFLKERDFEKRVNEISAKVLEKFISQLFNKRLMWTSSLKNE